jgi:LysM repeat protein
LVIGILLIVVGLAGPGAVSFNLFATATPTPTITPTATNTPPPTETLPPVTETPLVTPTPSCPPEYTMQTEDYLTTIATRCGVTVEAILAANPSITDPNNVQAGKKIILPPPGTGFTPTALPADLKPGATINVMVEAGDSLTTIAARFLSTVEDIKRLNKITDAAANNLFPGTWLKVRYGIATPVPIRNSPTFGPTVTPTATQAATLTPTKAP